MLRLAGLAPGCCFVEFGCGLGYVTRWAAGEGAIATGIDVIEERVSTSQALANEAGLANSDFRTANIYNPGLHLESLDIAYCRLLPVHLNRPVDAMRVIYQALRPGRVMVCEEAVASAMYTEPRSAAYEEMLDVGLKAGRDRGR